MTEGERVVDIDAIRLRFRVCQGSSDFDTARRFGEYHEAVQQLLAEVERLRGLAPLSKEQQLTQGDLAAVLHDVLERELGEVMWHPTMEDVAAAVLVRFGGLRVGQTPEREGKS